MKVCKHWEDGLLWARLEDSAGNVWDEPIIGWSMFIDLLTGETLWRHADGRIAKDWV